MNLQQNREAPVWAITPKQLFASDLVDIVE